jgi:ABC-2 type transport system ATP-binding protein
MQINKIDKQIVKDQIVYLKKFYDPAEFKGKKLISQYSTGNKHKIGIVSVLLSCPKIVVLDEPFANLDPTSQIALKKIIRNLQNDFHTTFLISSHNLDHVVEISNRILLFEKGKIIYDDLVSVLIMDKLVNYFSNQLSTE